MVQTLMVSFTFHGVSDLRDFHLPTLVKVEARVCLGVCGCSSLSSVLLKNYFTAFFLCFA